MDWWIKLKEMVVGAPPGGGRATDRKDPRLPAFIMALCSLGDESAFSVEITGLSVSGMKLVSQRRVPARSVIHLRVPVGLNFEDRDTNEYVSFTARTVWTQRRPNGGFEAGVRYLEGENAKRDRWINLVLQSYGVSLADDRRRGEVRQVVLLPVWLRRSDNSEVAAEVQNLSGGGLQVQLPGARLQTLERLGIEFRPPSASLCLSGHVVHAHPEDNGNGRVYGIAFDALSDEQHKKLLDMMTTLTHQAIAAQAAEPETPDDDEDASEG